MYDGKAIESGAENSVPLFHAERSSVSLWGYGRPFVVNEGKRRCYASRQSAPDPSSVVKVTVTVRSRSCRGSREEVTLPMGMTFMVRFGREV